jgi:hypothetical protein
MGSLTSPELNVNKQDKNQPLGFLMNLFDEDEGKQKPV